MLGSPSTSMGAAPVSRNVKCTSPERARAPTDSMMIGTTASSDTAATPTQLCPLSARWTWRASALG